MKYILHAFTYLCILTAVASCDKFTDIHKEFIEGGEIIYAVKPDSVVFIAGKERLKMKLWMENGQNIKHVVVLWNGGVDSLIIPLKLNTGRDSIEAVINGLEEKAYAFNIYSMDNFGHRSLMYTQFGTTFGDGYAATVQNRRLKKVSLSETAGILEWFAPAEGMILNEIKFVNSRGTDTVVRYPSSSFNMAIEALSLTTFQYRSLFIPQSEAIDTFYSDWASDVLPEYFTFDRSNWEAIAVSDETASDGGGKDALLDGNLGSYWHSQWGPNIDPPHWVIIDMTSVKNISYFNIYRRAGNKDAKSVQFFVGNSDDPDGTWTLAGEGVFGSVDMLKVDNTASATGRYLKIFLPDSNRPPFTAIAEVYAFGK